MDTTDEEVLLEWNGEAPGNTGYRAAKRGEWTTHTAVVKGSGGMDKLAFRESSAAGANDSTGPFLDSIHMSKYTPVKQASTCADGNLIKNCSFEDTDIDDNSYSFMGDEKVPAWTSLNGQPIELWGTGFLRVPASHGSNFVEMVRLLSPLRLCTFSHAHLFHIGHPQR